MYYWSDYLHYWVWEFILKEWKGKINSLGRKMKERICSVHSVVLFCPWFLCQSVGKEKKGKNWFSFLQVRNIFLPCQPLQQLWIPQKVMEVNPISERNHVFWISGRGKLMVDEEQPIKVFVIEWSWNCFTSFVPF